MKIKSVNARQILDSRGNPTIEVEVITKSAVSSAAVPSGASTGSYEALELRDKKKEYGGKGVSKAIKNVLKMSKALKGKDVDKQKILDDFMIKLDGTKNKKKLGANSILGVSMACSRAGAAFHHMPLYDYLLSIYGSHKYVMPIPFANVINGGVHAGNDLMFQEFMLVPVGAKSFADATKMISETYHVLKEVIGDAYGKDATSVGDEGGFAPPIKNAQEALELMSVAVKKAGYKNKIKFAMDVAASEFYDKKSKLYEVEKGRHYSSKDMLGYYEALFMEFPIISVEDPFHEDDYEGFIEFTKIFGKRIQVVGDDLLVTNPVRIAKAISGKWCNSLLLKINQIGTISEAMQAAHMAQSVGWKVMVSHRSGETEDPYIADLAVGIASGQIKLGAPCRGERTAKYNQLLRIEEKLGKLAKYAKF
ncbi:phosphopyruvate hydratase [Candidatus Woesearchaeota archaeon]|nr:phosphopyruvate hydratase [Candidatus Woesearchaeota archaeon]MCF7901187.1 phosphopyruvate hydratase [Candidatus Woesearchaeota archaeon]MCF8013718.1 phosphopyruvate hydratase [Candidatus Woesearchaeota archaeon]